MWKIVWGESEEFLSAFGRYELQGTRDYIEQQLDIISPLSAIDEKVRLYEKVKGGWQEIIKL